MNPGSLGLPAYAMESGSPHARYALPRRRGGSCQVEHVLVSYDWDHAAQVARDHQRPDWAQ